MNNKEVKLIFCVICIIVGCIIFGCTSYKLNKYKEQIIELTEEIEQYKQAANPSKERIDSLVYNISYRDSVIINIKNKYVEDTEYIKNMPDSSVVDMFKELVWAE